MLKLVGTTTSTTNGVFNINFKASFSHICVEVASTAKAGAGVQTLADFGNLRYIKRNEQKIVSTVSMLKYWCDTRPNQGQSNFFTSTTASLQGDRFFIAIPRGLNDGNVDYVTPEDGARVEIDFGANFATNFINPTTSVFLYQATGIHKYDLIILRAVENLNASQQKMFPINIDNISEVWFSDVQNPGTANATLNENLVAGASGVAVTSGLTGIAAAASAQTFGNWVFQIGNISAFGTVKDALDWTNAAFGIKSTPNTADTDYLASGNRFVAMANVYTDRFGAIAESLRSSAQLTITDGSTQAAQACVLSVGKRFTKTNKGASEADLGAQLAQIKAEKQLTGESSALSSLVEAGIL